MFFCIVSVWLLVLFNGPLWSDLNKDDDDDDDDALKYCIQCLFAWARVYIVQISIFLEMHV